MSTTGGNKPKGGAPAVPITKPSRLIAAAKAGEDELIEEYLTDASKNIDVNKVDSAGAQNKGAVVISAPVP